MTETIDFVKYLAILSGGLLAGANTYISTTVVPLIKKAPLGTAYVQWQHVYHEGKYVFPSGAIGTSLLLLSVGYNSVGYIQKTSLVAAALNVAIIPFTALFMFKNIAAIDAAGPVEDPKLIPLIDTWGKLNTIRSSILTTAFALSLTLVVPIFK